MPLHARDCAMKLHHLAPKRQKTMQLSLNTVKKHQNTRQQQNIREQNSKTPKLQHAPALLATNAQ